MSKIIGVGPGVFRIDGETYFVPPGVNAEQAIRFMHGHSRARAFGAIRRAAEVARDADRCAEELWKEIDDPWEDSGAFEVWRFAAGCRAAIRAAIGSPKA